mmetsp:Transcript_5082/g.9924  ORF Transcript_5082/g.9924 Transcript_5082/m.9924 type:complete len:199 (+) Transcript_5082:101-697(+)
MAAQVVKSALRAANGKAVKIKRLRQITHVNKVRELVRDRDLVVVAHVGAMTLSEKIEINDTLLGADAKMSFVKNTLKIKALQAEGLDELVPLVSGSVAVCAGDSDVKLAKALIGLSKKNSNFFALGGVLAQRQVVEAADLSKLATMPPRDEVMAAMVSAMLPGSVLQIPSPASGLAAVLQAHVANGGGDASESKLAEG